MSQPLLADILPTKCDKNLLVLTLSQCDHAVYGLCQQANIDGLIEVLVSTFNKKCHIRKCAAIHILFTKIHLPSHSTRKQGHSCVNPEKEYLHCPHLHIMFERSGKLIRSQFYGNATLIVAVAISS